MQITNVPKVKLIISKIYENNLLLAQRYGYSPKEKAVALIMPAMMVNMKGIIILMIMAAEMPCWEMLSMKRKLIPVHCQKAVLAAC
ncbi:MAG: hypothetical protein IPJ29_15285 [Chitinophagaceae bacterium]|nr:hypothetical protein [Chitinophagaceae bacterium]